MEEGRHPEGGLEMSVYVKGCEAAGWLLLNGLRRVLEELDNFDSMSRVLIC